MNHNIMKRIEWHLTIFWKCWFSIINFSSTNPQNLHRILLLLFCSRIRLKYFPFSNILFYVQCLPGTIVHCTDYRCRFGRILQRNLFCQKKENGNFEFFGVEKIFIAISEYGQNRIRIVYKYKCNLTTPFYRWNKKCCFSLRSIKLDWF